MSKFKIGDMAYAPKGDVPGVSHDSEYCQVAIVSCDDCIACVALNNDYGALILCFIPVDRLLSNPSGMAQEKAVHEAVMQEIVDQVCGEMSLPAPRFTLD